MQRLIVSLACLSAFGFAGGAMADPPQGKATILHCGCVLDAADQVGMAYVQVSVSSKAKGHLKHIEGTLDSCVMADGITLVDFERTGADCQLSGSALSTLAQCVAQTAGAICGQPVQP